MDDEPQDVPRLREKLRRMETLAAHLQEALQDREESLARIHSSRAWRVLLAYLRFRDRTFPLNTKRRERAKRLSLTLRNLLRRGSHHLPPVIHEDGADQGRDLAGRQLQEQLPSSGQCRRFALYVCSLGNYFFHEIRDVLAVGLQELGFEVELRNERDGFSEKADWHVVVAPHEFFYLGFGSELRQKPTPAHLILLNTEQPSTPWFTWAYDCFANAFCIWDMHYGLSQGIVAKGIPCHYLPAGYVSELEAFREVKELPENYGTRFLEPAVRSKSYLHGPLARRPIDVLFIGTLTKKRDEFFAGAAPVLSKYLCYLNLPDTGTKIPGVSTHIDTATAVGLAQRSKIVVNIHRGDDKYFEWHRIVMHGIWQKAFVLSEPCTSAPPFQTGIDYIEAPLQEIPRKIDYYLSDPKGRREAQVVANHGFETLSGKGRLSDALWPLILKLYIPETPSRFWRSILSSRDGDAMR